MQKFVNLKTRSFEENIMICNEVKITDALGQYLFNTISIGGQILPRAHKLQEEDIVLLKQNNINKIFVAQAEDGDIDYKTALGEVAAKLCGKNTAYSIGEDGICRIVAGIDGIFMINEERVAKFNRHGGYFILNTIQAYKIVQKSVVIAELELNLPIVPQKIVDEMLLNLSGNSDMLSVHDISAKKVGLFYTRLTNDKAETRHFTSIVKRLVKDFPNLDLKFGNEYETLHQTEEIANVLQRALREDNDILFVLPGQQTRCPHDVLIKALNSLVDEIVCPYLPQVGAGDFIIASKKGKKIIVIPYNYGIIDSSYAVRYIKQAIVADKLHTYDFNHPQNFIIQEENKISAENVAHFISSEGYDERPDVPHIAAVVLAAGVGSRCGKNKLLADVNGQPLFMRALMAAVRSKASPVFLITGHQAEAMEEFLDKIDINVLYNSAYRSGIRTSIALGIKSVPAFCDGVILIPADMPNVTAEEINHMISAFEKGKDKQVIMCVNKGKKTNPIIWSKDLYEHADIVPEDSHLRPVFVEFTDHSKLLEVEKPEQALDVTYPLDLEDFIKANTPKKQVQK